MYKITATITGLVPLRYNRFLIRGKEQTNKKRMTVEEQKVDALERSYYDKEKGFYIPKHALRAASINGGKKVKIGRGAASKLLEAIMIFDEEKYYLNTHEHEIQEDVVRIPPKTGARVVQYWVVIPNWECSFSAVILDDLFPVDGVKESIQYAGMYYGLLDGRPQLGRFELTDFKKEKN
jgi:hypothetical protein